MSDPWGVNISYYLENGLPCVVSCVISSNVFQTFFPVLQLLHFPWSASLYSNFRYLLEYLMPRAVVVIKNNLGHVTIKSKIIFCVFFQFDTTL